MQTGKVKKIAAIVALILCGLLFGASAYLKLFPIEPFEYLLVDTGFISWKLAPILARFIIGAEFALGLMLVSLFELRKVTIKATIGFLAFFIVYLVIQIIRTGNSGSCGCMGEAISITPLEGIIKNLVMIGLLVFSYKALDSNFHFRFKRVIIIVLSLGLVGLPYLLNPLTPNSVMVSDKDAVGYKVPLEILYNTPPNTPPATDLTQGKHVIAFFSLTCPHCRIAAKKMHSLYLRNPKLPFYMVLNGKDDKLKDFFEETKTENIPYCRFNGAEQFVKMAGASLPVIMWVDNSIVEKKSTYYTLDEAELIEWSSK
jgi:hypothetical protein